MDRKIMVEVTKEELELLDKEVTLENIIDKFVNMLREHEPCKRLGDTDPITGESAICRVYELDDYTIKFIVRKFGEPEINIIFKPKKKELK